MDDQQNRDARETGDWIAVFRTDDSNLLPYVCSALEGAGIPYLVQGGAAPQLFPLGPLGSGLTRRALAATLRVPPERAQEAREFLASFEGEQE